ncbi:MAG TPA: hypothetical protein VIK97_17530, partial [Casimicrobiaceae bacterium]
TGKVALVLDRTIPDLSALDMPKFDESQRSVLADDIKEMKIGYFGRDSDATVDNTPTWRDRWDDAQQLPMLIRIDVTPAKGQAWPTLVIAPRAAPEAGCRGWDAGHGRCVQL